MDFKRVILFSALVYISLNLYQSWLHDYPQEPSPVHTTSNASLHPGASNNGANESNGSFVPDIKTDSAENKTSITEPVNNKPETDLGQLIRVKTDVLDISIQQSTGNIVHAALLKYGLNSKEKDKPFVLLTDGFNKYVANSSLFYKTDSGVQNLDVKYSSANTKYQMGPNQNELKVVLTGKTTSGLMIKKTYSFNRGEYLVNMDYQVQNNSDNAWIGQMNTQLLQENPSEDKSSMFHVGSYSGAAVSDPSDKLYQKISFSDISSKHYDKKVTSGWVAMQQHYFLSAWIPKEGDVNHFYSRFVNEQYIIGMVSQPFTVAKGQSKTLSSRLYVGPEITSVLEKIAPGLNLTVDYGILSVISIFLFAVMSYIHKFIGNWGWSIVLVTLFIKLVFYRLSAKSYKSMANMRKLQPKIMALRERYANDKAKLSQETMELYRKEQVNPLGGCLPIIIQIPVFIALYWVLLESVELRQAPWILWIHDLSEPDPLYILPVVMGLSMLIQQKLGPASPDPTQAKMMMLLPLVFTFLFANFPSGLVLYWTVNNTLSIIQQWYITKKYSDEKPTKKKDKGGWSNKKLAMSK